MAFPQIMGLDLDQVGHSSLYINVSIRAIDEIRNYASENRNGHSK